MVSDPLTTVALKVVATVVSLMAVKSSGKIWQWVQDNNHRRKRRKASEDMIEGLREIEGEHGFL